MTPDDTVTVPLVAAPNWAPAWAGLRVGETLARSLDATQWVMAEGTTLTGITVALDPALVAAGPAYVLGAVCTVWVGPAGSAVVGSEALADFTLTFSDGETRLITVREPILVGAPAGLVPVAAAISISLNGAALGYGGQPFILGITP